MPENASQALRVAVWLLAVLFLAFLGLQLIRPALDDPPVIAEIQAPPEVKQILRQSCYNCHSNETHLPWFDQVVPAYWIVASDVKQARAHLNFSEIGAAPAAKQKATLFEAINQIQAKSMPLPAYLRLHPEAKITPEELTTLRKYLASVAPIPSNDPAPADAQYAKWIADDAKPVTVQPEFNGLEFLPDYKNWKPISSTDRFDNGTMRFILANEIAMQAIAANRIKPWPNGSAFAKVTWFQQADAAGGVRTGAFQQVELMIKDSKKYASTLGWGFGRWRGADLKPYGDNAAFAEECVGCHTPERKFDYVFTTPRPMPNANVITSTIDRGAGVMSALFGNPAAVQYARSHADRDYPPGSVITFVTWKQQEDDRWFGGNVPAAQLSTETLTFPAKTPNPAIPSLRAAVMP